MSIPPSELRRRREQMLLRLLLRTTRVMNDETIRRMAERGHSDMQPSYPRLLGNLDAEGTRIGALARRMGTSRQAASQLLQEIEQRGYIERRPDPDDKRGVIVNFTARGRKGLAAALAVMTEIEAEYLAILGVAGFKKLKLLLGQLAGTVDPDGALGLD